MMRLAERTAEMCYAQALITGESLAQVASQTMQALCVTDSVVKRPVFRPCIRNGQGGNCYDRTQDRHL